MGRVEQESGVTYETRGSSQGAQIARAFDHLSQYQRRKRLESYRPKMTFSRKNLTNYNLRTLDMHDYIMERIRPKRYAFYACGFGVGCIVFSKIAKLIFDADFRYQYLVKHPKQMKIFDNAVNAISSRFWYIGHEYFGDFVIPKIDTEEGFYNFTYAVKNKIFKIEQRQQKSKEEFEVLKSSVIYKDVDKFDEAVSQQDRDMKRMLWQVEQQQDKDKQN